MNIFDWLFGTTAPAAAPAEENLFGLQAKPVTVNASLDARVARHVGRLARLYAMRERGDDSQEVKDEIRQRQAAMVAAGQDFPKNRAEAEAQLVKG